MSALDAHVRWVGIHHVALKTARFDFWLGYFSDTLSMELGTVSVFKGNRSALVHPGGAGMVHLIEIAGTDPAEHCSGLGYDHLAFKVRSEADARQILARVVPSTIINPVTSYGVLSSVMWSPADGVRIEMVWDAAGDQA